MLKLLTMSFQLVLKKNPTKQSNTAIFKVVQETFLVNLTHFKKEIPGCNWWYPALWRLQKRVSSWALIWLEVGNINSLWTKAWEQEKTNLVYKNTAAIRHLLMFYKGLPKFIKKYISLSVPFLRKGMLPAYVMTRMYWKGFLVSTNYSKKNSNIASIVLSERGCLLTGQWDLRNNW